MALIKRAGRLHDLKVRGAALDCHAVIAASATIWNECSPERGRLRDRAAAWPKGTGRLQASAWPGNWHGLAGTARGIQLTGRCQLGAHKTVSPPTGDPTCPITSSKSLPSSWPTRFARSLRRRIRRCHRLCQIPAGFVSRRLSMAEDGTWMDHVHWSSMEAAQPLRPRSRPGKPCAVHGDDQP